MASKASSTAGGSKSPAKTKRSSSKSDGSKPTMPKTANIITEALDQLDDPKVGISLAGFKLYIRRYHPTVFANPGYKYRLRKALLKGLESGVLTRTRKSQECKGVAGSFRLAPKTTKTKKESNPHDRSASPVKAKVSKVATKRPRSRSKSPSSGKAKGKAEGSKKPRPRSESPVKAKAKVKASDSKASRSRSKSPAKVKAGGSKKPLARSKSPVKAKAKVKASDKASRPRSQSPNKATAKAKVKAGSSKATRPRSKSPGNAKAGVTKPKVTKKK